MQNEAPEGNSDRIVIRIALPKDSSGIAFVHVATWQQTYRGILPNAYLDKLRPAQRESMWAQILTENKNSVHVACEGDEVIGFASAGTSRDDPSVGEIYAIYVHPERWNSGVGWRLFRTSCSEMRARNFERMMLWVATENSRARAFYEREGMVSDGNIKNQSIGGCTLEEMRYRLDL